MSDAAVSSQEDALDTITNRVIPIDAIKPHERNYRSHPESQIAQLKASHQRFKQYRSVVVWERPGGEYVQVGGHGIVQAMRERGVTHVRADILPEDTPEEDIDGILVADNLLPEEAEDDSEALARLLQEQLDAGYDLAALGSDEETLRQMLESMGDEMLAKDADRMPTPGDAESVEVAEQWGIIITCQDEQEQLTLLERFQGEGIACRALVL